MLCCFALIVSLLPMGCPFLVKKAHLVHHYHHNFRTHSLIQQMALTPVGPFCPFRSSAAVAMEPRMERLNQEYEIAKEMSRIQLELQAGQLPDAERLQQVAKGVEEATEYWERLMARLRLSSDFQTREYAKLTQAHMAASNMTVEAVAALMKWQASCMRAMANKVPPPMPPSIVDLEQLAQAKAPSISSISAAEAITQTPFNGNEEAFQSPTVMDEYKTLCRDHMSLIEFGSKYESFDPLGKLRYLDEIDKIQERWDIFFARFSLLGALNQEYVRQCNEFLNSMGLNEEQYRELLKNAHQLMRDEAEEERNRL